jgi:hypothetical protein
MPHITRGDESACLNLGRVRKLLSVYLSKLLKIDLNNDGRRRVGESERPVENTVAPKGRLKNLSI